MSTTTTTTTTAKRERVDIELLNIVYREDVSVLVFVYGGGIGAQECVCVGSRPVAKWSRGGPVC